MRSLVAASMGSLAVVLAAACSKPGAAPSPAGSAGPAAVSTSAAPSAAPVSAGPVVSIPAGKLTAGTACGDHPRLPGEELAGEAVDMGAFDVDAYPYPNDPAKPPETRVSRDEAKKLCEARGRRLCTELEWERACKGPSSSRYEYGDRFDPKACPAGHGAVPSYASFEKCASGFGVHAMHGFGWEWTASEWKRGKPEGKGVLRGGYGNQPYAHMRCSGAREGDPVAKEANVGFRCCGGKANAAEVVIPADDPAPPVIAEETTVDDALLKRLLRALGNGAFKDPEGATSTFAKVWRWHPAPKEEILLVRYESKTPDGAALVQPLVVRLCDKTVQLIGRLKGPVEKMGEPVAKEDTPGVVTLHVEGAGGGGDVKLTYQFAQVAIDPPAWLKPGAPAASASAAPRPPLP
jgi:formylglycine-generating enzyme required for sulfatase activity